VNVGDSVKAGQVICELEHGDAQLKLDQARANLEQARFALRQAQSRVGWIGEGSSDPESVPEVAAARASYESAQSSAKLAAADAKRYENLVKSGDISQSAWEKYRTQNETAEAAANAARRQYEAQRNSARQSYGAIEGAQAAMAASESQLAQAQKGLADTFVRAPFEGFVSARPVAVGQWVGTNNSVATVVRIAVVKLQLKTPEKRAAEVKAGMVVTAQVAAYPDRQFAGTVTAVVPSVDPSSRTFLVEARLENPKAELRPGMFATAKVTLPVQEKAVFVPATALLYDKTTDAYQVFTVSGNAVHLNVVLKGDTEGGQVRILSGLTGDETVATSSLGELYDGAAVRTRT
jgi:multidrug efflux pump subunit AcrA (membrane-fusion protein)